MTNKRTNIYMHNRVNACVDEFILAVAEEYNPDWNITIERYVNAVRDRVYKQLKQYEQEMTENKC